MPGDFDGWANEEDCAGWSYREVLPYFRRAEDNQRFVDEYHGYGGPVGVSAPVNPLPMARRSCARRRIWHALQRRLQRSEAGGLGHYQVTVRDARRSSAVSAYLAPSETSPNDRPHRCPRHSRRNRERPGGRCRGVENGTRTPLCCEREVLVASGGIGSPRLLLLSGMGPAEHLRAVACPWSTNSRASVQPAGPSRRQRHGRVPRRLHL